MLFSTAAFSSERPGTVILRNDTIKGLDILTEALKSHRIVLSGEDHRYAKANVNLELSLMKFLHQNGDFRNLILELGYSRGYLVDRYINNLEDSTLEDVLGYRTLDVFNNYFEDLRTYNLSLPPERRIHVHGIDVERFPVESVILLNYLMPADSVANLPENIAILMESIRVFTNYKKSLYEDKEINYDEEYYYSDDYGIRTYRNQQFLDTLAEQLKKNKEAIVSFYASKNDKKVIESIIESFLENQIYHSYMRLPQEHIFRETRMTEHFMKLLKEDSAAKFYGQFGSCHINQTKEDANRCFWYDMKSMAGRLKEKGQQPLSIAISYDNRDLRSSCMENYMGQLGENELRLFKVVDSCYKGKYQFVIVSRNTSYYMNYAGRQRNERFFRSDYAQFSVSYGYTNMDFDALNRSLFSNNSNGFKQIRRLGISGNFVSDNILFGFGYWGNQTQKITVGKKNYALSGYMISERFAFTSPIKNWMALDLGYDFSFSRLKLKQSGDSLLVPQNNGFDSKNELDYVNNAITIGLFSELKFRIGRAIGAFGGVRYQLDPSFYRWRKAGVYHPLIATSPKTSHGGFSFSFGLNLYIFDNY